MKKSNFESKALFICLFLLGFAVINAQPTFQWAKKMGSNSYNDRGYDITTDAFGNVYSTGFFIGIADFDPGAGTYTMASAGPSSNPDIYISKLDVNGNFVWAKQIGANAGDYGRSIAIDGLGNVFVTGSFVGTADFDPGSGTFNLTSLGNSDPFILKLDPSGNFVWAKSIGGAGDDNGCDIAVDASGNVFTIGYFSGTVDFDPGAGTYTMSVLGPNYSSFILKLDASGSFVFAKQFNPTINGSSSNGNSIALDATGNIYSLGTFAGNVDFDPGAGTYTIAASNADIFISKLDVSGNFIWAKNVGGISAGCSGNAIALDVLNNVYSTGYYSGTVDFDPGPGAFPKTSAGQLDTYVLKLDVSGSLVWAKTMGGTGDDEGTSITISNTGEVYSTGYFGYPFADFDPGPATYTLNNIGGSGIFISKLDASGNFVFAEGFGCSNTGGKGIALDSWGDIYTTGYFDQITDFDPSASTYTLTGNGSSDIFVHKQGQPGCPTFSINSTTSSYTLMCSLNTLTLNAINTTTYSSVTYTWVAPSSSTATGASYTLGASGIYTVSASVSSNTCIVTQVVSIIQTTGNVNFNINTIGSTCNNNGTASVSVTSGVAPYTYTWSAGGTGTTVSNLAPGNYTVNVTDANSCSFTQSFTVTNDASTFSSVPICFVTVDSLSQHNVITWDKTVFPTADSFFVYRETGTNFYQEIRKQPYSAFSRFVDTVQTLYFPNTGNPNVGTYRYKMKVKDNCSNFSDYSPYHNTLFMVNNNGTFSWTQLYQIEGDPNPVLAYVLERDNMSTNNWAAVGSVAGTQQFIVDPNYSTYQATGAWRVRTQWNISCIPSKSSSPSITSSYSNRITNNNVGVKQNDLDQYLSIYPNPTNGKVTIALKNTSIGKKMNLEIHNVTGEKVYSSNGEIFNNLQIDLSGNANGIYFITLTTETQVSKGKMVIEK